MNFRFAIVTVGLALVAILGVLLANILTTGPTLPEVPPGAVIEVLTKEATDGQLNVDSTAEDLAGISFDLIHPLSGPIYVDA